MEAFIEAVQQHPCIWNPLIAEHREMIIKEKAWENIVEICKDSAISNVEVAKMEWKKLRGIHRDALKRAHQGKTQPFTQLSWKYYKLMSFLEPHMKYKIPENVVLEPPDPTKKRKKRKNSAKQSSKKFIPSPISQRPKRKCTTKNNNHEENKSLQAFFLNMYQCTKKMSEPMQSEIKKRIYNVITEAEEQIIKDSQNSDESETETAPKVGGDNNYMLAPECIVKVEITSDTESNNS